LLATFFTGGRAAGLAAAFDLGTALTDLLDF
jgi:hypothetical protein